MGGYFLKSITFIQDYRCFKEGEQVQFRPGVNFLVGDQGSGKSTILNLLSMRDWQWKEVVKIDADSVELKHFDFERDNNRMQRGFAEHLPAMLQCQMQWSSHGEVNRFILGSMSRYRDLVFLMDEPDQAMSLRSVYVMAEVFEKAVGRGCQLIASIHNPELMRTQDQVLDLEKRSWVSPDEFIEDQRRSSAQVRSLFGFEVD